MARPKTLPKPPEADDGSTKQIRVFADIAEMISWIVRIEGGSAALLLDPLIRPTIRAKFEVIRKDVEELKRMQAKEKEVEARAKQKMRDQDDQQR